MPIVKFQPFSSLVSPTLWHELTRVKLDVLHLSDASVPLTGSYTTGKTIRDRNTGQDVALGCNLSIGGEGFEGEFGSRCVCVPFAFGGERREEGTDGKRLVWDRGRWL